MAEHMCLREIGSPSGCSPPPRTVALLRDMQIRHVAFIPRPAANHSRDTHLGCDGSRFLEPANRVAAIRHRAHNNATGPQQPTALNKHEGRIIDVLKQAGSYDCVEG